MEGTSGAADPVPLRGGAGDAILDGIAEGAPRTGPPGRAGLSSRQGRGFMTRGVRADRVGKKLSSSRPQGRCRREAALERGALLAREDSTGERSSRRRHPNRYRDGIITRGSGRACRCGLRASRKRGRRAERASARSGCARRGSGDRAGVLADCGGCRSRRAALGPDRKVGGLAPASRSRERRG